MKNPAFIGLSMFSAYRSTTMQFIQPPIRTIARSLGSVQGLLLIVGLGLALSTPPAQAETTPEQLEPSVQDRKSAWKVHAVRGNRPLYRRGGEILVQYQPGATREALNTSALAPMIQGTRASRGEMEAVIFDEDAIDFATLREQLLATPGVLRAEPNVLFSTQSDESPFAGGDLASNQWHLESTPGHSRLMALSRAPLPIGQAIRVGVIDTGVDYAHTEFKGRTLPGVNLISHPLPDEDPESEVDLNGHGTRVAGIIAAADDDQRSPRHQPSGRDLQHQGLQSRWRRLSGRHRRRHRLGHRQSNSGAQHVVRNLRALRDYSRKRSREPGTRASC